MKTSAILLVGGKGTRLQPLTNNSPKPMLPVGGVPFTEHQIIKAREAGISEIVLATSYLAEIFQPYFGDGSKFGIAVKYAVEEVALGTGGAIHNAAKLLAPADQVVIFNGDVLSAHDLTKQIKFHEEKAADVTLYLTEVADARAYGSVELLAGERVKSFLEKMENPPSNLINAGCYVFNRNVIDEIAEGKVVSVERETFPKLLAADKKVFGFVDRSYWLDISNDKQNVFINTSINGANNGIYKFGINESALPANPFVAGYFYGIGVDPLDDKIYAADPLDFSQDGIMWRYNSSSGMRIDSIRVGKVPNGIHIQ